MENEMDALERFNRYYNASFLFGMVLLYLYFLYCSYMINFRRTYPNFFEKSRIHPLFHLCLDLIVIYSLFMIKEFFESECGKSFLLDELFLFCIASLICSFDSIPFFDDNCENFLVGFYLLHLIKLSLFYLSS